MEREGVVAEGELDARCAGIGSHRLLLFSLFSSSSLSSPSSLVSFLSIRDASGKGWGWDRVGGHVNNDGREMSGSYAREESGTLKFGFVACIPDKSYFP